MTNGGKSAIHSLVFREPYTVAHLIEKPAEQSDANKHFARGGRRRFAHRDGKIVEITNEPRNQVRTLIKMGWNAPAR